MWYLFILFNPQFSEEEYKKEIKLINKNLQKFAPNQNTMMIGILCCPLTIGISLIPTIFTLMTVFQFFF
jgi:hypothetical protein